MVQLAGDLATLRSPNASQTYRFTLRSGAYWLRFLRSFFFSIVHSRRSIASNGVSTKAASVPYTAGKIAVRPDSLHGAKVVAKGLRWRRSPKQWHRLTDARRSAIPRRMSDPCYLASWRTGSRRVRIASVYTQASCRKATTTEPLGPTRATRPPLMVGLDSEPPIPHRRTPGRSPPDSRPI